MREDRDWHKPELIVLARSRIEESVLSACKLQRTNGGTAYFDTACQANAQVGCPANCQASTSTS